MAAFTLLQRDVSGSYSVQGEYDTADAAGASGMHLRHGHIVRHTLAADDAAEVVLWERPVGKAAYTSVGTYSTRGLANLAAQAAFAADGSVGREWLVLPVGTRPESTGGSPHIRIPTPA